MITSRAVASALLAAGCVGLAVGCKERTQRISIPGATLQMGCDLRRDPSCAEDERPQVPVVVPRFRIDLLEVTRGAYGRCVAAGACTPPPGELDFKRHPKLPVTQVTWHQARAFCAWRGARLPTEAEWELAARGTDGRVFPWGDEPPTCARAHTEACGSGPAEVGARPEGASPYGVLDMAGNVDEWVEDAYAPYGSSGAHADPTQRVARGGAYDAWHSRTTARNALHPSHRDSLLGFRCAAAE
jgi:formylglycine-generating enzyme required for sulfatase activity